MTVDRLAEESPKTVEFLQAFDGLLDAAYPFSTPELDRSRPASRTVPIPGEQTARYRRLQEHVESRLVTLTHKIRDGLDDPIVWEPDRCGGCGRGFRQRPRLVAEAEKVVRRILQSEGRVRVGELMGRVMQEVRCSQRTVNEAGSRLKVQRERVGNEWWWSLKGTE